jgi:hypothetical protein
MPRDNAVSYLSSISSVSSLLRDCNIMKQCAQSVDTICFSSPTSYLLNCFGMMMIRMVVLKVKDKRAVTQILFM